MKLIFLRHGKAEERGFISDSLRRLLPEGRAELRRSLPFLAASLRDENVLILSSPLLRALETAQVLGKWMGAGEIQILGAAEGASLPQLLCELSAFSGFDSYLIVGHEPYLSLWTLQLCGVELNYRKGAVAAIDCPENILQRRSVGSSDQEPSHLSSEAEIRADHPPACANPAFRSGSAKLLWSYPPEQIWRRFLPAEIFDRGLTAEAAPEQEFCHAFPLILKKSLASILENRGRFLRQTEETESIHQLRVSIRRHRALISLVKPLMAETDYLEQQQLFRGMAQSASLLREIDVLMELAASRGLTASAENNQILIEALREKRRLSCEKTRRDIENPRFEEQIIGSEKRLLNAIPPELAQDKTLRGTVFDRLDGWTLSIARRLIALENRERSGHVSGLTESDPESDLTELNHKSGIEPELGKDLPPEPNSNLPFIHRIRLKAKKIRYLGEVFQEELNPLYLRRQSEMKALQTELGKICDAMRNQTALGEIFPATDELDSALRTAIGEAVASEAKIEAQLLNDFDSRHWLSLLQQLPPPLQEQEKDLAPTSSVATAAPVSPPPSSVLSGRIKALLILVLLLFILYLIFFRLINRLL